MVTWKLLKTTDSQPYLWLRKQGLAFWSFPVETKVFLIVLYNSSVFNSRWQLSFHNKSNVRSAQGRLQNVGLGLVGGIRMDVWVVSYVA